MTWFKHKCWYCGLVSHDVEFIVGDGNYQCKWELREECEQRRRDQGEK